MELVNLVRQHEADIIKDIKFSNSLLAIRKLTKENDENMQLKIAALHSMRRIFVHFLDNITDLIVAKDSSDNKMSQFKAWYVKQYYAYVDELKVYASISASSKDELLLQAPAVRTLLEFTKREHIIHSATPFPVFGRQTFEYLLYSLLQCEDIHLDILLVVRDEIFCYLDCVYYAFLILRQQLVKVKRELKALRDGSHNATTSTVIERCGITMKNILDIVRMIDFEEVLEQLEEVRAIEDEPLEEDEEEGGLKGLFLVVPHALSGAALTAAEMEDCSSDESEEEDFDDEEDQGTSSSAAGQKRKASAVSAKAKQAQKSAKKDSKAGSSNANRKLNRAAQLKDLSSYKRAFSNLWLSLLSVGTQLAAMAHNPKALKLANDHNKLILKHLCKQVVPYLSKPLLLADYLTTSYRLGTNSANNGHNSSATAILALESLFQLIAQHNLDYPSFFQSLYGLCTVNVFSGSYRGKFLKLLHLSLKSGNLPAYVVASFAKRLMFLATQGASIPCASFCVAQTCWLLRAHPQCMPLLHRQGVAVKAAEDSFTVEYGDSSDFESLPVTAPVAAANKSKASEKSEKGEKEALTPPAPVVDFNAWDYKEVQSLEQGNAINSSLFELEILKLHYYPPIAELVGTLESNFDTTQLNSALSLAEQWNCNTYLTDSYSAMIERELSAFADTQVIKERKKHFRKGGNKNTELEGSGASDQMAALNYRVTGKLMETDSLCGKCFG